MTAPDHAARGACVTQAPLADAKASAIRAMKRGACTMAEFWDAAEKAGRDQAGAAIWHVFDMATEKLAAERAAGWKSTQAPTAMVPRWMNFRSMAEADLSMPSNDEYA